MEFYGLKTIDGVIHGFFSMAPALDKASIAIKEACDAMNQWM
jgi:hypothetical protein